MKQKYYNTSSIHVGFLGYVKCDENGAMWTKMKDCPCVIYEEKLSETLDNAMEAYDVFSDNHYFFYNSVTNSKKNILEIVCSILEVSLVFTITGSLVLFSCSSLSSS